MKKFFSLVLALVMALSLTTVAWGAATTHTVADKAALDTLFAGSTVADGDTIQLVAGVNYGKIELTSYSTLPKNITIIGASLASIEIYNGSGTEPNYNRNNVTGWKFENVTFTGEGLTFYNNSTTEADVKDLTLINCAFEAGANIIVSGDVHENLVIEKCTFATASSNNSAIMIYGSNGVTIKECTFTNPGYNAIQLAKNMTGAINIQDNVIEGTASRAMRVVTVDGAVLNISGNTMTNANNAADSTVADRGQVVKISGAVTDGTFANNTHNGVAITFNGGVADGFVAKVGDVEYASLQEAVTAAASAADKTVTMLSDVTVASTLVVDGITLDGNGYTLTSTVSSDSLDDSIRGDADKSAIYTNVGCTIKNLTIVGGWKGVMIRETATQATLLDNVHIENSARGLCFTENSGVVSAANLTVKNSTLAGWNSVSTTGTVTFENTTFAANASTRGNGLNPRGNTTLTNCTVNTGVKLTTEDVPTGKAITINGGTYNGTFDAVAGKGTFVITAGTFSSDVSKYVAPGMSLVNGTVVNNAGQDVGSSSALTSAKATYGPTLAAALANTTETVTVKAGLNGSADLKAFPTYQLEKKVVATGIISNDGSQYVVVPTAVNADVVVVDGNKIIYLAKAAGTVKYNDTAKAVKVAYNADPDCGDVYVEAAGDAGMYYLYKNAYYVECDSASASICFNVDGVAVYAKATNLVKTLPHTYAYDVKTVATKTTVTKVYCKDCKAEFSFVEGTVEDAVKTFGAGNYADTGLDNGTNSIFVRSTATVVGIPVGSTTLVESAETFDAGIAMYVGMSVLAATGSAVVIGKKKD